MLKLPYLQSLAAMFATCLALWVTAVLLLIAYLHLHACTSATCRERLKPQVERLLIESRWMEHHAKSPAEFSCRWGAEVAMLHKVHVSRPRRAIFWIGSFRRALDAEFASVLEKEIESWTFFDRASFSPARYEQLMLRFLHSNGWRLDYQDQEHFILIRDRKRAVVRLQWADRDIECLAVSEVAAAAERVGCTTACVITNGRFSGAAIAMAEEQNVLALHYSQLELLTARPATRIAVRRRNKEGLQLAA